MSKFTEVESDRAKNGTQISPAPETNSFQGLTVVNPHLFTLSSPTTSEELVPGAECGKHCLETYAQATLHHQNTILLRVEIHQAKLSKGLNYHCPLVLKESISTGR